MESTSHIAGWREVISLPDWQVGDIVAKLDTGARSSCIDARDMVILEGADKGLVQFTVPVPGGEIGRREKILDWRLVRDSGGHAALRPVIAVNITLGTESWTDEATLYDRAEMMHRVLLGRRVTANRFLVDSASSFLLTTAPQGEPNDADLDESAASGPSD